ncbi:nuclear transport factor 2 family protein [soil metagenome]
MNPNARLIQDFYAALEAGNGEFMASAYSSDASFTDPVFDLRGDEIGAMWTMFCSAPGDIEVVVSDIEADDRVGRAHWEPKYRFGRPGRPVHNRIDATFEFLDGTISVHRDDFSFPRWARQALGLPGWLFGSTGFLQERVRTQAAAQLKRFMAGAQE